MTAKPHPNSLLPTPLRRDPAPPDDVTTHLLPTDPRMGGAPAALAWVRAVLLETQQDPAISVTSLRLLRDGDKRLAVVGLADDTALVLKQYADERGAWTQRWLHRLTDARFTTPARFNVTTARGWSPTHRTLVTDMAPEHPWTHWLTATPESRDAAAGAAAEWLVALQSCGVALPDRTGYRAGVELAHHFRELGLHFPAYSDVLRRVGSTAHERLYGSRNGATLLVASHGDLHPNNLHIAADGRLSVTAIDIDTAGRRRPAYDVGYAVAQLLIVSWMNTRSFHDGACAGLVFLRRWSLGGAPDAESVAAEVVRTLLQSLHFELITYRNGRTELLDSWLHVAQLMLTSEVPDALQALVNSEEISS